MKLLPVWSHVLSRGSRGLEEGECASGVGGCLVLAFCHKWPSGTD